MRRRRTLQNPIHLSATAVALEQQWPNLLPGSAKRLTSAAGTLTTQVPADDRRMFPVLRATKN